jgi:hypothetical protein
MPHFCRYCSRSFQRPAFLERHIISHHSEQREFDRRLREDFEERDDDTGNTQSSGLRCLPSFLSPGIDEDVDLPPAQGPRGGTEYFPNAGSPIGDSTRNSHSFEEDPFHPFIDAYEYKLAQWFIENNVTKTAINEYFNTGLGLPASREGYFKSAQTLWNKINQMDEDGEEQLKFEKINVDFGIVNTSKTVCHRRDPVNCVKYLLGQAAYTERLLLGPIRGYNAEAQRVYSELNTADWWWREQVC